MKNHVSKEIALSVLRAIFSAGDVRRLGKLRGIVLCGLPGCGKTTIANLLEDGLGFERLSSDQVRTKEMFKHQGHRHGSHKEVMSARYLYYEELAKKVGNKLASGGRVVVDGTHLDNKRMGVLGTIMSKVLINKMAVIVIRTPDWIIKKRFRDLPDDVKGNWLYIYKYWREFVKSGKGSFITKKEFPRLQIIKPRRYAIRTFEWIPEIKAIGWDLDGTLYPKHAIPGKAIRGRQYSLVAKANNWSYQKAKEEYEKKVAKVRSNTKTMTALGVDGSKFFTDLWDMLDLGKYIKRDLMMVKTIKRLKGMRHFILSNSNRMDQINKKLRLIGLNPNKFEVIVSTVGLGAVKPDPKPFRKALRQMNLKPEEVMFVGDRAETDVMGANNMGMRSCLVRGRSQEADVCLKTTYEVAELFGKEV